MPGQDPQREESHGFEWNRETKNSSDHAQDLQREESHGFEWNRETKNSSDHAQDLQREESHGFSRAEDVKPVVTGVLLTIGGFVLARTVIYLGINALVFAGIPIRESVLFFPIATTLQGLGFGIAVAIYIFFSGLKNLINIKLAPLRDLAWVIIGFFAIILSSIIITVLQIILNISSAENEVEQTVAQNPELLLYMIPLAFLVIGPGEELLFRGAIQGVLRQAYPPLPAISIASVLFGMAHLTALTGDVTSKLVSVLIASFLGAILGVTYERTHNIFVPSIIHGAYNALAFILLYLQLS